MTTIYAIDIGTTETKAVIQQDGGLIMKKYKDEGPNEIFDKLLQTYGEGRIFITGSGERFLSDDKLYTKLDELEATAYVVKHLGMSEGLVTNIGTGTSFTLWTEDGYKHLNGTGIGGGTFYGLGQRMLGVTDDLVLEAMASKGNLAEINVVIDDIYPEGLGWLAGDVTVSNFGKEGGGPEDVALGIHSMVTESIVSMVRALLYHSPVRNIVVCGGVTNNSIVRSLFKKYSALFGFETTYLEDPSFGTSLGMMALINVLLEEEITNVNN